MNSNDPKRHHYIPKMLLNNFLDDKSRIWIYDKNREKLYQGTPTNTFVQKNLYRTLNFDHENYSYEAEEELSRIESHAAPVIRRIIKCARNNEHPKLSIEERCAWKRFYHASCRRTPEFAEEMLRLNERYNDVLHIAIDRLLLHKEIDPPDRDFLDSNPILNGAQRDIKQNIKAGFASGGHLHLQADVNRFSRETGLLIAVIRQPSRSFVIGSHGVAIVQPTHKRDQEYGGWLPIAHDIAVAPTASPDEEFLLRLDRDKDRLIRRINRAAASQSRIIAGRSKALICSLMQGQ